MLHSAKQSKPLSTLWSLPCLQGGETLTGLTGGAPRKPEVHMGKCPCFPSFSFSLVDKKVNFCHSFCQLTKMWGQFCLLFDMLVMKITAKMFW